MSSTITAIATRLVVLFTPGLSSEIFALGLALFVASLALIAASLLAFMAVVALSVWEERAAPLTMRRSAAPFDETRFLPFLGLLLSLIGEAFMQFLGSLVGAGRTIGELVVNNPRRIIVAALVAGFIALYLAVYEIRYPAQANAWNCFVGPLVRPTVLPSAASLAFLLALALPFSNFVSRAIKTATTGGVLHAVVGAFAAFVVFVTYLSAATFAFGTAQNAWIRQPEPPGAPATQVAQFLRVAPDFGGVGANLGLAFASLEPITDAACAPLTPYVWHPLLAPFSQPAFASFVNNTLALPYVATFQFALRPIAQYLANRAADPGGSFADHVSAPSLNSTFDVFTRAHNNLTTFFDAFPVELAEGLLTLVRDVTDLPIPSPVGLPRRGLWTLAISTPLNLIVSVLRQTANIVFAIVFDTDTIFSYPRGVAFWLPDDTLFAELRSAAAIFTDVPTALSSLLRRLGDNFEAEFTDPIGGEFGTVGGVINVAFQFAAGLVDRVPCIVNAILDATIKAISVSIELVVGTLYSFVSSAFSGTLRSPFDYAQRLYGDELGVIDVSCLLGEVGSTAGTRLYRVAVNGACTTLAAAARACSIPAVRAGSPNAQLLFPPPPGATNVATQNSLNQLANICRTTNCEAYLALNFTGPTVETRLVDFYESRNRFRGVLVALVDVPVCVVDTLAAFCLGSNCPLSGAETRRALTAVLDIAMLAVNFAVHLDRIATSYFFDEQCFPAQSIATNLVLLVSAATNQLRAIFNSATPVFGERCSTNYGVATSEFQCCALNVVDASANVAASAVNMLVVQAQQILLALLPAGANAPAYTPPVLSLPTAGLAVLTTNVVCLPSSIVPASRVCVLGSSLSGQSIRSRLTTDGANILLQVLLLLPTMASNAFNGLVALIVAPSLNNVSLLITNTFNPVVLAFGGILRSLSNLLSCVDSTNVFSTAFSAISGFFLDEATSLLPIIINLILGVVELVIGVLALFRGNTAVLLLAIDTLAEAFVGVAIAFLGQSLICGINDAVCAVSSADGGIVVEACNTGVGTSPLSLYDFAFCDDEPTGSRKRSIADYFPECEDWDADNGVCRDSHDYSSWRGGSGSKRNALEQSCYDFITTYGYRRAAELAAADSARAALGAEEQRALACYAEMRDPAAIVDELMRQKQTQDVVLNIFLSAPAMLARHWAHSGSRITAQARALYDEQKAAARESPASALGVGEFHDAAPIDLGLVAALVGARLAGESDIDVAPLVAPAQAAHAKRSLGRVGMMFWHDSFLVNLGAVLLHAADLHTFSPSWDVRPEPTTQKRAEPPHLTPAHATLALGGRLAAAELRAGVARAGARFAAWSLGAAERAAEPRTAPATSAAVLAARRFDGGARSLVRYGQARGYAGIEAWAASGDRVAALAVEIDPDVLPVFGLPECDLSQQIICTDCKYVDDLVLVAQRSVESAQAFFERDGPGSFGALSDQLSETFRATLEEPQGTDTYTTEVREIPFITERLWNVRWAWQWDYSELLAVINEEVSACDASGADPLAALPIDEDLKAAFRDLLGFLIPIAQQAICRATVAPAETAMRLVERYVTCDYDHALLCEPDADGAPRGVGLFDGFMNAVLALAVIGLVIEVVPMGSTLFALLAFPILFYGTFWIGYMAPPTCTLPALGTFGAFPVCAPMDAYRLLEETLPPALPYPIPLIDPDVREQYSSVLITDCATPPPPSIDCTRYGFGGIYDNIFYTTGVLLGGDFNARAAAALARVSEAAAASAARFTPAFIASLEAQQNAGDVCNRETFVAAFFGLLGLAAQLVLSLLSITFLVPFLLAIIGVAFVALYIASEAADQADTHYVHGGGGSSSDGAPTKRRDE